MNNLYRRITAILACLVMAGCSAMQGVNVGASIPIGGIGGVGVSKTIGDGQKPAARGRQDQPKPSETEEDETDE
ncbi:MAG: hypothetical protein AAF541_19930 [Pseudomonadota bacterium]